MMISQNLPGSRPRRTFVAAHQFVERIGISPLRRTHEFFGGSQNYQFRVRAVFVMTKRDNSEALCDFFLENVTRILKKVAELK